PSSSFSIYATCSSLPGSSRFPYTTLFRSLLLLIIFAQSSYAQQPPTEITKAASVTTPEQQEVINLSKKKWDWMADKNVDSLKVLDRKSTRLNSSHVKTSYAVFCLKKNKFC